MKLGRQAMTTAAAVAAAMVAALAWAGPAAAQEFVKVNEAAREQIPAVPFVAAAYAFIWVAVLVYIGSVARRMVKLRGEMDELRRRLDMESGQGSGPPR